MTFRWPLLDWPFREERLGRDVGTLNRSDARGRARRATGKPSADWKCGEGTDSALRQTKGHSLGFVDMGSGLEGTKDPIGLR